MKEGKDAKQGSKRPRKKEWPTTEFTLSGREDQSSMVFHAECGCGNVTELHPVDIAGVLTHLSIGGVFGVSCSCNPDDVFFRITRIDKNLFKREDNPRLKEYSPRKRKSKAAGEQMHE